VEVTLIRSGLKRSSRNDNFSGCPQSPVFYGK